MNDDKGEANRDGGKVRVGYTRLVKSRLGNDKVEKEGSHELEKESISRRNEGVESGGAKGKWRALVIFTRVLVFTSQAATASPDKRRSNNGTEELGSPVAKHLLPRHLAFQHHEKRHARIHVTA